MDHPASSSKSKYESLVESCKPGKKRGRQPSHKRQLQEIREEKKLNLQTADSVVVATNLKSILTVENIQTLPVESQEMLIKLLPEFDQIDEVKDKDSGRRRKAQPKRLSCNKTALNNEHFARFCSEFIEKLSNNKLSDDAVDQAKQDKNKDLSKLDQWKLKNYEPIWGQKLVSQVIEDDNTEERKFDKLMFLAKRKKHLKIELRSQRI